MNVRPANRGDAAGLAEVHAAAFDAPWTAADILRFAEDPGGFMLVAQDGEAIVGFILCRVMAGEGEILTLAVRPESRRRGAARVLVEAAAVIAGQTAAAMFLEVADDNAGAIALYAQAGFSVVGRRTGYYARRGAAAVDAVVMRRALNS
jgi:[ribosomal protein S18]-alanine N-acetyltransferase